MKTLITLLILSASLVSAEEMKSEEMKLPAFEKSLSTELFFNKEEISVGLTYGFATNKNLDELKPLLLKFLGEGWTMEIAPEKKAVAGKEGKTAVRVARLLHKDMTEHEVAVVLGKMPADSVEKFKKYTYMLSIVTGNKAKIEKQKSTR